GGFCGAINTIRRQPFTGDDGGTQDDRGPIRQQRKRLLHREQEAFDVDVEDRVVEVLSYRAERGVPRNTGVREHDIKLALLPLDLGEEAIEIGKVRNVALYTGYVSSDLLYRRRQLRIAAPRDEDVRAFLHEMLGRCQANAAVATRSECDLSFKLTHGNLLSCPRFFPMINVRQPRNDRLATVEADELAHE